MRMLQNVDVERVLDFPGAIDALRASYEGLAVGDSGFAPRIDLLGPVPPPMSAYRWGSMSGNCLRSGVVAVRIKSDVVGWEGAVEQKHCVQPGLYSGIVIVYAIEDGRPLALLQDGVLQHVRLGAAVGLGASALLGGEAQVTDSEVAPREAVDVGILGSGGMAWSCIAAAAAIVPIRSVRVYSPSPANREAFAERITGELELPARAVTAARDAVSASRIVMSATSSTSATLEIDWTEPDAVLTFVSRREVPDDLRERVPDVCRLGDASLPIGTQFPGLDWFRGGYAGIAVGDRAFRARLPKRRAGEADRVEQDLPMLLAGLSDRRSGGRSALIAVGTQGLQFASVAGYVVKRAEAEGLGTMLPDDWFLQDIRD